MQPVSSLGHAFTNPTTRLTILKVILIIWGLATVPWMIYLGLGSALPSVLTAQQRDIAIMYEHMLTAIYISLAICGLLSAADPLRHKLLLIFIIVSGFAHGGIMIADGLLASQQGISYWMFWQSAGPIGIAIAIIIFYPRGIIAIGSRNVSDFSLAKKDR